MIMSNLKQVLYQRRAAGSLSPRGPGLLSHEYHFHCLILPWVLRPKPVTGTSQDRPRTIHPHPTFLARALLTDPPESEGIQDKWLRGWS